MPIEHAPACGGHVERARVTRLPLLEQEARVNAALQPECAQRERDKGAEEQEQRELRAPCGQLHHEQRARRKRDPLAAARPMGTRATRRTRVLRARLCRRARGRAARRGPGGAGGGGKSEMKSARRLHGIAPVLRASSSSAPAERLAATCGAAVGKYTVRAPSIGRRPRSRADASIAEGCVARARSIRMRARSAAN